MKTRNEIITELVDALKFFFNDYSDTPLSKHAAFAVFAALSQTLPQMIEPKKYFKKVQPSDNGKFVTVSFTDGEEKHGILLDVIGEDDARVWFPHTLSDKGGHGSNAIVNIYQIVSVGPNAHIEIPFF